MTGHVFAFAQKVLFKHCDPAGIVFYPRYFEMMNDCVEAFFSDALNAPFEELHRTGATPTVTIETTFPAPSRHGDELIIELRIVRLGTSSLGLKMQASCNGDIRFETTSTLVKVDRDGRPDPWPPALRTALAPYLGDTT